MAFPLEKKMVRANGFAEKLYWILSLVSVRENILVLRVESGGFTLCGAG